MILGDSMASAIIHICVAERANEILKKNNKEFILGSIAPDISKQVSQTKAKSHFLSETKGDVPQLERFLAKYQDTLKENDFNLGYFCHLFTDMIWFAVFMPEYCNWEKEEVTYINGEKKKLKKDTIIKLLYNDYTNLNIKMIDEYALDLSLFYEDPPIINSNIEEIPIAKLPLLIDKMGIIIEDSKERDTIIFNTDAICHFIDKTAADFINCLKEIGII